MSAGLGYHKRVALRAKSRPCRAGTARRKVNGTKINGESMFVAVKTFDIPPSVFPLFGQSSALVTSWSWCRLDRKKTRIDISLCPSIQTRQHVLVDITA